MTASIIKGFGAAILFLAQGWRRRGRGAGELRAGRRLPASGAIKS
jgi:hypothetical protein